MEQVLKRTVTPTVLQVLSPTNTRGHEGAERSRLGRRRSRAQVLFSEDSSLTVDDATCVGGHDDLRESLLIIPLVLYVVSLFTILIRPVLAYPSAKGNCLGAKFGLWAVRARRGR